MKEQEAQTVEVFSQGGSLPSPNFGLTVIPNVMEMEIENIKVKNLNDEENPIGENPQIFEPKEEFNIKDDSQPEREV